MINLNLKGIGLTGPWFERVRFGFPNLPKCETDALLIQPSHLVMVVVVVVEVVVVVGVVVVMMVVVVVVVRVRSLV